MNRFFDSRNSATELNQMIQQQRNNNNNYSLFIQRVWVWLCVYLKPKSNLKLMQFFFVFSLYSLQLLSASGKEKWADKVT